MLISIILIYIGLKVILSDYPKVGPKKSTLYAGITTAVIVVIIMLVIVLNDKIK